VPDPTTSRSRSTPSRYRQLRAAGVVLLVAAAIATTSAASVLDSRTDRMRTRTGPVLVATQQLFSSLAETEAAATAVHLSGSGGDRVEDREQRRTYEVALARSMQLVERVASLIGDDDEAHDSLASIASGLATYAGTVESARTLNRAGLAGADATLAAALEQMSSGIGAEVQRLTAATADRLDEDDERPVVPLAVAAALLVAALAVLVITQVFAMQRSRRILNPLVLGSTVVAIGLLGWLVVAENRQRADLDLARNRGYDAIALTSSVQSTAYGAKAAESLALIGSSSARPSFQQFETEARALSASTIDEGTAARAREGTVAGDGTLFEVVRSADDARERAAATEVLVRWQRYRATNAAIQAAVTRNDIAGARTIATTSSNQAFTGFNLAVESVLRDNTDEYARLLSNAQDRLRFLAVAGAVLPILAALALVAGLQPRLREYR
jgi:hypothetical protein